MQKIYTEVTDRILAELERGFVPWRRDWASVSGGMPMNAITSHHYRGVNVPLLWVAQQKHQWPTLKFLTYRQASELKAQVRGGSKAAVIVFTKKLEIEDKATGEKKTIAILKTFRVFNIAQCDNLPENVTAPVDRRVVNPDSVILRLMPLCLPLMS